MKKVGREEEYKNDLKLSSYISVLITCSLGSFSKFLNIATIGYEAFSISNFFAHSKLVDLIAIWCP